MRVVLLALVLSAICVSAQSNRQQVKSLPGYGAPPTKHWSGFVEVEPATKSHLFYYVVESQSDPANDPLVWWFNGGPGASSLVGLFAEVGPLLLNEDNKLVTNPFAWNKKANLVFVEFGEGIGYSYCANSSRTDLPCKQSNGTCSPCLSSDSSVADKNVVFIETLLNGKGSTPALFPEFKGNPLYLTGESYAGVYIPTLAHAMLSHFEDTSIVNLHGLWMTDPCTDNKMQGGYLDLGVDFAFQKGFISSELFTILDGSCTAGRTAVGDRKRNLVGQCKGAWRMYDLATAGIGDAVQPAEVPGLPMYMDPLSAYGPSGGTDLPGLIGSDEMRKAVGAEQSLSKVYHLSLFNNGYVGYTNQYKACNPHPFPLDTQPFGQFNRSMLDVYRDIIGFADPSSTTTRASAANLHSVIVSTGDVDPVVDNHGTESAIGALGLGVTNKGTGKRRPWYYNATAVPATTLAEMPLQYGRDLYVRNAGVQLGGFVTNYDTRNSKLTFDMVTVHASGHMVPQYAPQKAWHVIQNSLMGGKPLAPQLPNGWDTSSDETFYALEKGGGQFATWVVNAMSEDFVNGETPYAGVNGTN